jgi:hypothetical protein
MNYITIVALSLILALSGVFIVRNRVVGVMSFGIKVLFVASVIVGITVLLFPPMYNEMAEVILDRSGVLETVRDLDDKLIINQLPDSIDGFIDMIKQTLRPGSDVDTSDEFTPGYVEKNIYPILITVTGAVLRIGIGLLALIGMVGGIYLSYATVGVSEVSSLKNKIESFENRLKELESTK